MQILLLEQAHRQAFRQSQELMATELPRGIKTHTQPITMHPN